MTRAVSISDISEKLQGIIEQVVDTQEAILITRRGQPIVQVIPYVIASTEPAIYPTIEEPKEFSDDFEEEIPGLCGALR